MAPPRQQTERSGLSRGLLHSPGRGRARHDDKNPGRLSLHAALQKIGAVLLVALFLSVAARTSAVEVFVSSVNDIAVSLSTNEPGDVIIMRDGLWPDSDIIFRASGTPENPITLRAQTPGKVLLTGNSRLRIAGSHLVAQGLLFTNGFRTNDVISFRFNSATVANNCRLTECAIIDYNPADLSLDTKWISMYGVSNRVDNCYLRGKRNAGSTLLVIVDSGAPNYHQIDHNYFATRPALGVNGGETIRVGSSEVSLSSSRTLVEHNYFERCDGDIEVISNKSCDNTYRHNTFFESEGSLTLRHGNNCVVEGNFFFGGLKPRTGGIRIIGEDHKVFNNYLIDITGATWGSGLSISKGLTNTPLNGYAQVKRALVAFNTFINCSNNILIGLSSTLSGSTEVTTLPPEDCIIANNIVLGRTPLGGGLGDPEDFPDEPDFVPGKNLFEIRGDIVNFTWHSNIIHGAIPGTFETNAGIWEIDPRLILDPDRLWRLSVNSPARGAAQGSFPFITNDFDGQPRQFPTDIGADQLSLAPLTISPASAVTSGPLWLRPSSTVVTWSNPAAIVYGTALGTAQLAARANVPGIFAYSPAAGTILNAGPAQTLTVVFTPDDLAQYSVVTQAVTIDVSKANPQTVWSSPANMTYGTALGAAQLNATANVPGLFVYNPPSGTVLRAGFGQPLSATFSPFDTANYNSVIRNVAVNVLQATPVITWFNPSNIVQGTALGAEQLNATANTPGTFTYVPSLGTVLNAGSGQTLFVTFAPFDTTNFTSAGKSVTINVTSVGRIVPTITWETPADLVEGTALSSAQLNAVADVPGAYVYTPPAGTVLPVGPGHLLSVTFTPDDTNAYVVVSKTVLIDVVKPVSIVRVAYIVPSNRTAQSNAVPDLQGAILFYQKWFREQMERNGFGPKTFTIETDADRVSPKIHVISVPDDDATLRGDIWGARVLDAVRGAGLPLGTPGQIWWLIPETHLQDSDGSIRGGFDLAFTYGGSADDAAWAMTGSDFLGRCRADFLTNSSPYDGIVVPGIGPYPLRHDISYPWFEGTTLSAISSSAIGSGLRALGEAFGLEHDFRNDQNFNGNVMGYGYRGIRGVIFPNVFPFNDTRLSYGLALVLNVNPYFNPERTTTDTALPVASFSTSGPIAPINGTLRVTFSASDNNGLSAALLCWIKDSERVLIDEVALNGASVNHTFVTPYYDTGRTNEYFLAVYDLQGNKRMVSTTIIPQSTVNHAPLPAIKASPVNVGPGEDVVLDASGTFDAEHDRALLELEWDLDGDGFFDTEPRANLYYTNSYPRLGTYLVRGRVTDPAGADALSAPITVNIRPCAVILAPTSRKHGFGATTNVVNVDAGAKCIWSATTFDDWITFINGTDRVGSGTLSYVIQPNPTLSPRIGVFFIGDQSFTINQDGVICTFSLSVPGRFHGFGATTNFVRVTTRAECPWTVSTTTEWITIHSGTNHQGSTGSPGIQYSITANRNPTERFGAIMLGDQTFTITQWGTNCTYLVNPPEPVHTASMQTGIVTLAANTSCAWTIINTNSWITNLSNLQGFGLTNYMYTVAANPTLIPRSGVIIMGNQAVTITQLPCSFTLSSSSTNVGSAGAVASIGVTAMGDCSWEVLTTAPWISVSQTTPTTGSRVLTLTIAANPRNSPRSAQLSIAGQLLTVTQDALPCEYDVTPPFWSHGEAEEAGVFDVETGQDCPWSVVNTNDWIDIIAGHNGSGAGVVVYTIDRNSGGARQGTILIGETPVLVQQARGLRTGSVGEMAVAHGQTNCLPIYLETFGNEAKLDLSLCYDPQLLTFVSAQPSIYVPFGWVEATTNELALGRVGLALRMPEGWSMRAGTQAVMDVCFRAASVTGNVSTAVNVCDQPVARRLLGVLNTPLSVDFTAGRAQIAGFCSFGESVDAPQFTWIMENGNWFCQTNVTRDGSDAAESPFVADGSSSSFFLNVVGPGTLSFWWKVSSQPANDRLRFYLDGSEVTAMRRSGEVDWEQHSVAIPSGETELEWRYSKDTDGFIQGADRAWVDQIQFVGAAPTITTHPASQNVSETANVTLSVSASGTTPFSYQWYRNGVEVDDGGNISGSTTAQLRFTPVQFANAGTYSVIVRNPLGQVTSSNAILTVARFVSIPAALDTATTSWTFSGTPNWSGQDVISHDGEDAAHAGGPGSTTRYMQTTVTGPGTVRFWWKVSSEANGDFLRFFTGSGSTQRAQISGEIDWQQVVVDVPSGSQTLRWSYIKDSDSVTGALDRAWVDRFEYGPMAPSITSHPVNFDADMGGSATFSVVAAGSAPLSYRWQYMGLDLADGNGIRGATTPSLTISNLSLAHAGDYSVHVSNGAGSAVSSNATLRVSPIVSLAEALDTGTNLVWTTVGSPWVGQTATSFDGEDAARSGAIPADTDTRLQANIVGPGVVGFWWKVSSEAGEDELMFLTGSVGSSGSERFAISGEVDWQWRTYNVTTTGGQTLQWRYQKGDDDVTEGQDRAWVDRVTYIPNSSPTAPMIVAQPTNRTIAAGGSGTFGVIAFGSPTLTYRWLFNGEELTTGNGISGGITSTILNITNAQAVRSGLYSCIVSNAAGTVTSTEAELRVITAPEIVRQPESREVRATGTTNFTVAAVGAPTLRYQWQLNGTNLPNAGKFSGVTTTNLVVSNVADAQAGPYTVVVTNAFGTVVSEPAFMAVFTPPSIALQPLTQTARAGTNLALRVVATGNEPLGYQWRLNGANLADGAGIIGSRSAELTLNGIQPNQAGSYSVVVTNPVGIAISSNANITVISPPVVTLPPASQNVNETASVNFSATAIGTAPLSYRWLLNGVPLNNGGIVSGVLTPTLTLSSVQPAHAGSYSVMVSNAAGVTVSTPASLTVRAATTLGEAVDAEHLTWLTSLSAPWLVDTNVTHDGIDAARCGNISSNQTSWIETTVEGPGTLRFWWKVSSEPNDRLTLSISSAESAAISGDVDWQWETLTVPPGTQVLRWAYTKNGSFNLGQDRGWLDEVQFTRTFGPSPPVIGRQPQSRETEPGTNVTFSVAASGSAPLSYQWHFNGIELTDGDFVQGSSTPTLTLFNVQPVNNGTYNVMVRNQYSWDFSSNAILTVVPTVPLEEAVDKLDTIWTTGATLGGKPWFGQSAINYDWLDAAQSGQIGNSQTNFIETLVVGPGAVSFWWKVSSETNSDRLRFYVNGSERANISGEVDWRWRTFDVAAGNQILRWAYTKNASNSVALDRAWVDFVQFGPSSPTITNQPDEEEVVDIGGSVKISVDATGTPPLTFQWRLNGTNLIDEGNIYRTTKDSLLISNAMPWQAGKYSVLVGNAGGRVLSEECVVSVIPRYPLDEALNTPGWEWRTYGFAWWVGDTDQPHDGVLCARNGRMPNSEEAWMETTLIGPGTLRFWWRVSSESQRDWLRFWVNSNELAAISGEVSWNQRTFELPPGTNIARWRYSKDSINTNGQDRAWVDEVSFGYTGPSFTTQPVGRTVDQGTTVTFTSAVSGTPPFTYQWRLNGIGINGATNATLTLNNVQPSQAGDYSVAVNNIAATIFSSNATLVVNPVIPIADAIDRPGSTWTVSGTPPWAGQLAVSHDGVDAARSGSTSGSGTTYMETVIPGPGVLRFWWRVSSQTNEHFLRFRVNGSDIVSISGESGWLQRTQTLNTGNNTLRWSYVKNSDPAAGQDRGWVDELAFTPNPPTITAHPTNVVVEQGNTVAFRVTAGGTPPFDYQWRFNGVALNNGPGVGGARTNVLTLTNVIPAQSGNYYCEVSNPSGTASSSNAFLTIHPTYSLAEALDTAGFTWATSGSPPWYGQGMTTHDGRDAAQSGLMTGSGTRTFQTTVVGPGVLSFWWKVSSYTNNNYLEFYVGSSRQDRISGEVDWQPRTFNISGSGNQTIRWVYDKNSSTIRGQDRAWVDEIVYVRNSGAPPPPAEPITAHIDLSGSTVRLSWLADPERLYYIYYKDDLAEADWQILTTEVFFDGATASAYDFVDPAIALQRFYIISEY